MVALHACAAGTRRRWPATWACATRALLVTWTHCSRLSSSPTNFARYTTTYSDASLFNKYFHLLASIQCALIIHTIATSSSDDVNFEPALYRIFVAVHKYSVLVHCTCKSPLHRMCASRGCTLLKAVYHLPTDNDEPERSVPFALQRLFYQLQTQEKAPSTKRLTLSFGYEYRFRYLP